MSSSSLPRLRGARGRRGSEVRRRDQEIGLPAILTYQGILSQNHAASANSSGSISTVNVGKTFYLTTPIYYVNGRPHIGSTLTTVCCDVLARYHHMRGEKTWFLTGTDEQAPKVFEAAEAESHHYPS